MKINYSKFRKKKMNKTQICTACCNKFKKDRSQNRELRQDYEQIKTDLNESARAIQLLQKSLAAETKNIEQFLTNTMNEIQQISKKLSNATNWVILRFLFILNTNNFHINFMLVK